MDRRRRTFLIERQGSSLEGHFLYHDNAFFSPSEGWDPPPMPREGVSSWPAQYNLRFSVTEMSPRRNLAVVLAAGHARLRRAEVTAEKAGRTELARIGPDLVLVNQGAGIEHGDIRSEALAVVSTDGRRYTLGDDGLAARATS